jgi:hypothetical protein
MLKFIRAGYRFTPTSAYRPWTPEWKLRFYHPHPPMVIRQTGITIPENGGEGPNNSKSPEQSYLLRWTEKIASLCFCPSGSNPIPVDPQSVIQPIAPQAQKRPLPANGPGRLSTLFKWLLFKVDAVALGHSKDGFVSEWYRCLVVQTVVPHTATRHLHALVTLLTQRHLQAGLTKY